MRAALYLVMLAGLATSACKKPSATDLSTPETTLVSFFHAVNESRIPDEAKDFIQDAAERGSWKLRCETRGCKKVEYKILKVEEQGERSATLIVDYRVYGNRGLSVMHGKASEVRLERTDSRWGIVQFGKRSGALPPKAPKAEGEAPEGQTP